MDEQSRRELRRRIGSALLLAPIALAAIYFGSPYFDILLTIGAVVMAWEWDRICGHQKFGVGGWMMAICFIAAGLGAWMRRYELALVILLAGSLAVYGAGVLARRETALWTAAGTVAVGVPCLAAAWIRGLPDQGFDIFLWLIGAVWATDLAAYVTGRCIGGAKLAPRISPGKTWAGLVGAIIAAAIWGLAWADWVGAHTSWLFAVLGAIAAVMAQAGDLAVSSVKRRFGVKDASNLIPGHGGVLDRFDGLLILTPALAALAWSLEGGFFAW